MKKTHAVFYSIDIPPAKGGKLTPCDSFPVLKLGATRYTKGGTTGIICLDQDMAEAIVGTFAQAGRELLVDYDHASFYGRHAPAAGWISALRLDQDAAAVIADVKWTPAAVKALENAEYRYMSPVIAFDADERPCSILSVALTNHPAFKDYQPLAADDSEGAPSLTHNQETEMELQELARKMGIDRQFDDAENGLSPADCIIDAFDGMKNRLETAEKELIELKAEKAVEKAFAQRKLVEAQRQWAMEYARENLEKFQAYAENAPVCSPEQNPVKDVATPQKSRKAFTDVENQVFKACGVTPDMFNDK